MKVVAIIVQSVDGLLTRRSDERVYRWTSQEDKKHVRETTAAATLIVLGSATYEAFKQYLKPTSTTLRIILTTRPDSYKDAVVPGKLEFSNQTPQELVEMYEKKGHKELLLLGGPKIYSSFLKAGLLHELQITIEPLLFGSGKALIETSEDVELELTSMEKLNERGTLLLKYKVL